MHDAENCSVCESVINTSSGGFRSALLDAKQIAPSSFFSEMTSRPPYHIPASLGLNPQDVECPTCLEFFDQTMHTS